MRRTCSLVLSAVLLAAVSLGAQPFWQKKKYTSWSKDEAKKILEDSPWSVSYAFNAMSLDTVQTRSPESRAGEVRPTIRYNVQLHSALPIRQAMVRQEQISLKYDQLPPEKKQLFDQDSAKFLGATFTDVIRVHVTYGGAPQTLDRDLTTYWQTRNPAELQNNVFLIAAGGQRVSPLRLVIGKGEDRSFDLLFPRRVDGKGLLDSPDASLSLEFPHPQISPIQAGRVLVEFKASKMLVDGQPAY